MVILERLALDSFLSHKQTYIDFQPEQKVLIDGVSGSGKSAIIEAIVWALYGEGRVENRSLVRRGDKKATVGLFLKDGETRYHIVRTVTDKGKHTLDVFSCATGETTFAPIGRTGLRDTQEWIEKELIGASYLLFTNSITYIQDNTNTFVKQTAARRKELLLEIVNAGGFQELYKKASEELSLFETKSSSLVSQLSLLSGQIADMSEAAGMVKELEREAKRLNTTIKKETAELESLEEGARRYKEIMDKITDSVEKQALHKRTIDISIAPRIASIVEEIESLSKEVAIIPELNELISQKEMVAGKIKELSGIREEDVMRQWKRNSIMANKNPKGDFEKKIDEITKQIATVKSQTTPCPAGDKCPYMGPHHSHLLWLEAELETTKRKMVDAEEAAQKIAKEIEELSTPLISEDELHFLSLMEKKMEKIRAAESKVVMLDTIAERVVKLSSERTEAEKQLDTEMQIISGIEKDIAIYRTEVNSNGMIGKSDVLSLIAEKKNYLSSYISESRDIDMKLAVARDSATKIAKNQEQIAVLEKESKEISSSIDALTEIKKAFGQKGIPAVVIDYITPRLEERINEILSQLSDFRIRIDTQRENSTSDGVIEGLFLTILNEEGQEFDFDSYSGGQKLKITVSIAEALASLQRVGFRIFDEVFFALDEQSTEDFAEVMDRLQDKFSQMICITHLRNVKDLFAQRILVSRVGPTSTAVYG